MITDDESKMGMQRRVIGDCSIMCKVAFFTQKVAAEKRIEMNLEKKYTN
jgi:hypothetical protein